MKNAEGSGDEERRKIEEMKDVEGSGDEGRRKIEEVFGA